MKKVADKQVIRDLIARLGFTQQEAADAVGVTPRTMRRYLDMSDNVPIRYSVQATLESMARKRKPAMATKKKAAKLKQAVEITNTTCHIGIWSVLVRSDEVILEWTCRLKDWPDDYSGGDEPYTKLGGNELLSLMPKTNNSGIDQYVDIWCDIMVRHWAKWPLASSK